jgi:hypothetical protein
MNYKLKVGDKIIWDNIGERKVYTIIDIDLSREPLIISDHRIENQILFQWEHNDIIKQRWAHSYGVLNGMVSSGLISIVERDMNPVKELKKFKLWD